MTSPTPLFLISLLFAFGLVACQPSDEPVSTSKKPEIVVFPVSGVSEDVVIPVEVGDSRCDYFSDAIAVMAVQGYDIDCNPPANSRCSSQAAGCTVKNEFLKSVKIWPDRIPIVSGDAEMHRILLHEAGHTLGYWDEEKAELYSWCHLTPTERTTREQVGMGWIGSPNEDDCLRVK